MAGVGDGRRVAELGRRLREAADVERHAGDLERYVGGHLESGLDVGAAGRLLLLGVLGQTVALDDTVVGDGVVLQQLFEPGRGTPRSAPTISLTAGSTDGELLLADGQVADHRDERGAERAGTRRDAAAARRGLARGGVVEVGLQGCVAIDDGRRSPRTSERGIGGGRLKAARPLQCL